MCLMDNFLISYSCFQLFSQYQSVHQECSEKLFNYFIQSPAEFLVKSRHAGKQVWGKGNICCPSRQICSLKLRQLLIENREDLITKDTIPWCPQTSEECIWSSSLLPNYFQHFMSLVLQPNRTFQVLLPQLEIILSHTHIIPYYSLKLDSYFQSSLHS